MKTAVANENEARPTLGLFTTLPIMWGENPDIGAMLDGGSAPDPVRGALDKVYTLAPLDTLSAQDIAPLDRLLLVQPRVLGDVENVALDDWVRGGGRLVLFADPMLTRESIYPLGDKRRPQDTVVLSPILARWGLALDLPDGGELPTSIEERGIRIPLRDAGRLRLVAHEAESDCVLSSEAVIARCNIGKGSALIIADAALFDDGEDAPQLAAIALRLIASAFAR